MFVYWNKYHSGYQDKSIYQFTRKRFSKNNQSDVSDCEQKKGKFNRTTIYRGREIMSLTDELDLCDDGNITSNKDKLLKLGKLLGVESKTCNDILNQGWNMADR